MYFVCRTWFGIVVFCCFILSGCATKNKIQEIALIPQDLTQFVKDSKALNKTYVKDLKKAYLKRFFSPFDGIAQHNVKALKWGINYNNLGYGENLLPYTKRELQVLEREANLEYYPSVKQEAIVVRNSNLRVLPTNKPRFLNPKLAGEGFPFDYWQNSFIYAGTPLLITHYSLSKKWAFVESGFVSGWIGVQDIALLKQESIKALKQIKEFVVFEKDNIALFNRHGVFVESGRIGMLLPLIGSTKKHYEALLFGRDKKGYAYKERVLIDIANAERFPMRFSSQNVAVLAQDIMGEKYGWGGMFGNRDCSMLLRDVLGNFGFYLPRNSQAQIRQNRQKYTDLYLDVSNQTPENKKQSIVDFGIPFATLLGMKGHIMLYLGEVSGKVYVLHDIWGLKTLQNETQEGRKIIGKIVVTDLEIGENIPEVVQDNLLIYRIYGVRNLFDKEAFNE